MTDRIVFLCVAMNLQTERVCRGLVELNIEELMFIINQRPNLSAHKMCGVIFQGRFCASDATLAEFDFSIDVDANQPELRGSKDNSVAPSENDLTIVHITDPHLDRKYQTGSLAACNETSCCRNDQPIPENQKDDPSVAASRWGDYRKCDSPLEVISDACGQIRRQHEVNRGSSFSLRFKI